METLNTIINEINPQNVAFIVSILVFITIYLIFVYIPYKINQSINTGYKYWQFTIPFYNLCIFFKMGDKSWLYLLTPILGWILYIVLAGFIYSHLYIIFVILLVEWLISCVLFWSFAMVLLNISRKQGRFSKGYKRWLYVGVILNILLLGLFSTIIFSIIFLMLAFAEVPNKALTD